MTNIVLIASLISLAYCMNLPSLKKSVQESKWAKDSVLSKHLWDLLVLPGENLDHSLLKEISTLDILAVQNKLLNTIYPWHGNAGERVIQLALEGGFIHDRYQFALDLCAQEKFAVLRYFLGIAQLEKVYLDALVPHVVSSCASVEERRQILSTLSRLGAHSASVDSIMASLFDLVPNELPPIGNFLRGDHAIYRANFLTRNDLADIKAEQIAVFMSDCDRDFFEELFERFPHRHVAIMKHGFKPESSLLLKVVSSGNLKALQALVPYHSKITPPSELYALIRNDDESSVGICDVLYRNFGLKLSSYEKRWAINHEQCFQHLIAIGAIKFDPQSEDDHDLVNLLVCSVAFYERLDLLLAATDSKLGPWFLPNDLWNSPNNLRLKILYAASRRVLNDLRTTKGHPIGVLAAKTGNRLVLELYLSNGGDPNVRTSNGKVLLDHCECFELNGVLNEVIELVMYHGGDAFLSEQTTIRETARKIQVKWVFKFLAFPDGNLVQLLPEIRQIILSKLLQYLRFGHREAENS